MSTDDPEQALDLVLDALANRHRREMVYLIGLQPCAISYLARLRGLSLPAIHKHIAVLDRAGLIHRHKQGRTTFLTLNRQSMSQLRRWVEQFHPYWGSDQASLENYHHHLATHPDDTTEGDSHR